MAIPTVITDLSATIASNSPAGGDQAFPNIDDYLRAAYGFIRQGDTKASDVASAATVDLGAVVGRIVDVTGTTTITSFGTVAAGIWRIVRFTGALTLTHNGTSLILPGGANITTAAGDCLVAVSLGSGNWVVTQYQRASGLPPVTEIPAQSGNSGKYLTTNGTAASWGSVIASGEWTPTGTAILNVSLLTVYKFRYIRIGNIVSFSGTAHVSPTDRNNAAVFTLTLPFASAFASAYEDDASGVIIFSGGGGSNLPAQGSIRSLSTDPNKLQCSIATPPSPYSMSGHYAFSGQYTII